MRMQWAGIGFVLVGVALTFVAWWLHSAKVGTFVSLALAGPILLSEGIYSLSKRDDLNGYTRTRLLMHGAGALAGIVNGILLFQAA